MERVYFYGAVPRTSLSTTINASATSIIVADATGWPTTGPFDIILERNVNEEVVRIASRTGNVLTVAVGGRGFDSTTAVAHTAATTCYVEHVLSANWTNLVAAALALQTTKGDLLAHNGTDLVRKAVGSNGLPLVARSSDAAGVAYEQVAAGGIADNAVTTAKILDANVTQAKLATDSVGSAQIIALNVDTAELAANAVTTSKITDANVTTAKLADGSVTFAKLATGAGSRLITMNATRTTVASSTTETTVSTLSVGSGVGVVGHLLRGRFFLGVYNDDGAARNVRWRMKCNGILVFDTLATSHTNFAANPQSAGWFDFDINIITATAQFWFGHYLLSGSATGTQFGTDMANQAVGKMALMPDSGIAVNQDLTAAFTLTMTVELGTNSANLKGSGEGALIYSIRP